MVDITYVDNLVQAVGNCLSAPDGAWNEVYNISNGNPLSMRDWFCRVLEVFDHPFNPKNVPESAARLYAGIMELISLLPSGGKTPAFTRFSVGYMAKSMTLSIDKAKKNWVTNL